MRPSVPRISRRIRQLYRRARLRLTARRRRLASQTHVRELSDDRDNESTRLSEGETVDWAGLWLAEVYAPSHAPRLIEGLQQLELEKHPGVFGGGRDIVETVAQHRGGPGAFANLGLFAKPGTFIGVGPPLGLPDDFLFLQPTFFTVAPGISVLIVQFALEDGSRRKLERTLSRDFHAQARPLRHGGHSVHHASDLKEERLGEERRRIRGAAEAWLAEYLPGAFATRLDSSYPTWDLLLTGDDQLFRTDLSGPRDWRDSLGFGQVRERWEAGHIEGLHLLEPMWKGRNAAVTTFAGKRDQLVDGLGTGYRKEVHSLLQSLHSDLGGLLAAWAWWSVLMAHGRQFGAIRDELAAYPEDVSQRAPPSPLTG